jgi:microsomal dipeptidase-like Zn-dependent dipeptidase
MLNRRWNVVRQAGVGSRVDRDRRRRPAAAEDYNSVDKLERLGTGLMKRGWTTTQVEELLGRNLLRLYGEVRGG